MTGLSDDLQISVFWQTWSTSTSLMILAMTFLLRTSRHNEDIGISAQNGKEESRKDKFVF